MSKNLTADMERLIDNFHSKQLIHCYTQQCVADELSELSGQKFSQGFVSKFKSKAIILLGF